MAVDFSLLPTEQAEPDDPPSKLRWTVIFFVLVLIGVGMVLLLWPKNVSTHTPKFWCTIFLFPSGVPTLIVLLRYRHFLAKRLDIELHNEVTRDYNDSVFSAASKPTAVLGTSFRISTDAKENDSKAIRSGSIKLDFQTLFAHDSEPAKVRWLDMERVELKAGKAEDDQLRQMTVIRWLFKEFVTDLATVIAALPARAGLSVHLAVSGMVDANQVKALWIENWRNADLLATPVELEDAGSSSLQSVDAWMDQIVEHQQCNARLVVTIQMHPLMSGSPAEGTTEAGVALLLVPDELAEKLRIDRQINLHRPVRGPFDLSNGALSHCVKWAGTTAAVISGGWQTGLDVSKAGTLRKASVEAGLESRPTDLDTSAGHAGIAAPWLATACAAQVLSTSTPRQIVFAGCGDKVDCAVLCLASA